MLRAVNRYTLEINRTGSPYFERAICFVKPEYAQADRLDLHRAAQQLIAAFDAGVEEDSVSNKLIADAVAHESSEKANSGRRKPQMLLRLLPMVLSALLGAGVTLLVMVLL